MSGKDLLDNVKVYKRRCRSLITRCEILIIGLREGDGAVPAGHQAALNEAEAILESIRGRVLQWTQLNTARSLLMQDAIRNGLDEYDRKIDTCIATYNIKIGQQLAQAREQHTDAAQRDISEIRDMVQDLLEEFTRYKKNPSLDISRTNPAFRTVVHDIEEETRETQLHDADLEENDNGTQSSFLSIDTFHGQMTAFSRSLVNLELTQSVGYQRVSTVCPELLPPLDFGENFTSLAVTGHSPSASPGYPSSSPSKSEVSGSISTQNSWSPRRTSPSGTGYTSLPVSCLEIGSQQPKRPSIIVNNVALGSQSRQRFFSIVPETVYPGRSLKAIKPETLENIIQHLLVHPAENDNEQRSVFFIAHPAFVAPLHVLRILTQQRVASQACVLYFLNDWLNHEHVIFDDDILGEMREFLASVNSPESEELDELVLEILHGIREKNYRRPPASLIFSPSHRTQRERPAPCDLAIALAVLEGERYKRIVASEYMACVSGLQPYPNLSAAIELNQLISKWVRSCILDRTLGNGRDGITARSKVKQYFVDTAKECRKLRNFSSSGAIINALQSEVIARLTATQGGMSLLTRWKYENLLEFFAKKSNYQDYRMALKNQQMCSIPWHDIQAMMEGDADTDEEHNSPRIHLERWARLKQRAMSASHYHVPFREEDARQVAKEYLTAGLQRVLGENFDQEVSSLILKAEEDKIVLKSVVVYQLTSDGEGFREGIHVALL